MIPHGLGVVITAPNVFKYTAESNKERHLTAAILLCRDADKRTKLQNNFNN